MSLTVGVGVGVTRLTRCLQSVRDCGLKWWLKQSQWFRVSSHQFERRSFTYCRPICRCWQLQWKAWCSSLGIAFRDSLPGFLLPQHCGFGIRPGCLGLAPWGRGRKAMEPNLYSTTARQLFMQTYRHISYIFTMFTFATHWIGEFHGIASPRIISHPNSSHYSSAIETWPWPWSMALWQRNQL